jgi:hypothetical protein
MNNVARALAAAGFKRAWVIDSEYCQPWGSRPTPHCIVARCVITEETMRLWAGGGITLRCPFVGDQSELFIAYAADAEIGVFLSLGWVPPLCILDLFPEFLRMMNGRPREREHDGLIDALAHFGEPSMGADEKQTMRELAIRGAPFTEAEKRELIDYCEGDVNATERLLLRMWRAAGLDAEKTFKQALWRGRYVAAVAAIRATGVPLNTQLLRRFDANWDRSKATLIETVSARYSVYEEQTFRTKLFKEYLEREKLLNLWPRLDSGALSLERETFSEMAKCFPKLAGLHELRKAVSRLRLIDLEIGPDGRNRYYLAPFRTKTGRNAPSTTRSIFGTFKAMRNLILAPEGYALAYCDWSSQELGIAAALSGDEALWLAYMTGNPYLAFAKTIRRAPSDATKKTHKPLHNFFKQLSLGVIYGMSSFGLARRLGISEAAAEELLRRHRSTYSRFWDWAECNVDRAALGLPLTTRFGWTLQYPPHSRAIVAPRTALNYPMQANAAEMMRAAAICASEFGLAVCCPVHDAFLIEAAIENIEDAAATLRRIMGDASEAVLGGGYRINTDIDIARWPDAYREEEGLELFNILAAETGSLETSGFARILGRLSNETWPLP